MFAYPNYSGVRKGCPKHDTLLFYFMANDDRPEPGMLSAGASSNTT